MRFIADVMVGKLARWLRVLGFDVLYSNKFEDREILRIAREEGRVILTRDTGLAHLAAGSGCLLIASDHYEEQIRQVLRAFSLKDFNIFSRCLECNTSLENVDKESVFAEVPPYVYLTQERFARCRNCERVYWHGTHADGMRSRAERWRLKF